jgi:hypothetical protein
MEIEIANNKNIVIKFNPKTSPVENRVKNKLIKKILEAGLILITLNT